MNAHQKNMHTKQIKNLLFQTELKEIKNDGTNKGQNKSEFENLEVS